jgi:hypothetical protein
MCVEAAKKNIFSKQEVFASSRLGIFRQESAVAWSAYGESPSIFNDNDTLNR